MKIKFLLPILIAAVGCKASDKETYGSANPAPGTAASPEAGYGAGTTPGTTAGNLESPMPTEPALTVEVVSVQPATNKITLRTAAMPGETVKRTSQRSSDRRTLSVDPSQQETLRTVKAGQQVTVTCGEPPAGAAGAGTGATGSTGTTGATGTGSMGATSGPITSVTDCRYVTMITLASVPAPGAAPRNNIPQ